MSFKANMQEFQKYGSRKFIICMAAELYAAIGNYRGTVESADFMAITAVVIGAYTTFNYLTAKKASATSEIDTGGAA